MSNNENDLNPRNRLFAIIAIIVTVIIIGIWLLSFFVLRSKPIEDRGNYGDMAGTVNSLFSGLALAGIILTILLQRNELSLQRKELRDTREEIRRSATAQENSEKALNRQAANLKLSAKLTALNTLVSHYTELEQSKMKGSILVQLTASAIRDKKNEYVNQIERLLEDSNSEMM